MKKLILAILMTVCLVSSMAVGFMGSWDDIIPDGISDENIDDGLTDLDDGMNDVDDGFSDMNDGFSDMNDGFSDIDDGFSDIDDGMEDDFDFDGDDGFIDDEIEDDDFIDDDDSIPEEFPPIANIKAPSSVNINEVVAFDGSGSEDPDGHIVSYEWNFGDRSSENGSNIDHAFVRAGTYTVTLTVTDNDGKTDNAKVRIDVIDGSGDNNNPVITSEPITEAHIDMRYVYDVEAEDADNDTLTYSLTESPEEMIIDSTTGLIEWTPEQDGEYDVIVMVEDNNGGSDNQSFTINVKEDDEDDGDSIIIDNKLAVRARVVGDEYISAGNTVKLSTSLKNIGENDLKNVKVNAIIQELGIRATTGSFEVEEGEALSKSIYLTLPGKAQGTQYIRLTYSNDDVKRVIYRQIKVI